MPSNNSDFDGETFKGVIGKTVKESESWWPEPVRAPEGSPNVYSSSWTMSAFPS